MSLHDSLYLSHIRVLTIDPKLLDCLTYYFKVINPVQQDAEFSLTFWAYKLDLSSLCSV